MPLNATLRDITIDNQQQDIVLAVTDFRQYEAPGFSPPKGLEVDKAEEEGKTLYGFIITVPTASTRTVTVSYRLAERIDTYSPSAKYNLYVFKQPGTENDLYYFSLTYPTEYTAKISGTAQTIANEAGKSSFLTKLVTDQDIEVDIKKG